jgi:hypothetical protein
MRIDYPMLHTLEMAAERIGWAERLNPQFSSGVVCGWLSAPCWSLAALLCPWGVAGWTAGRLWPDEAPGTHICNYGLCCCCPSARSCRRRAKVGDASGAVGVESRSAKVTHGLDGRKIDFSGMSAVEIARQTAAVGERDAGRPTEGGGGDGHEIATEANADLAAQLALLAPKTPPMGSMVAPIRQSLITPEARTTKGAGAALDRIRAAPKHSAPTTAPTRDRAINLDAKTTKGASNALDRIRTNEVAPARELER